MDAEWPESRLRWLCRRGMKELDELLTRYLRQRYPDAGDEERSAFIALLQREDPDVYDLLSGRMAAENAATADLLTRIRAPAGEPPVTPS